MFAEFELKIHEMAEARARACRARASARSTRHADPLPRAGVTMDVRLRIRWAFIQPLLPRLLRLPVRDLDRRGEFRRPKGDGRQRGRPRRYLGVLRAGGSDYRHKILVMAGLDMASAEPYRLIMPPSARSSTRPRHCFEKHTINGWWFASTAVAA